MIKKLLSLSLVILLVYLLLPTTTRAEDVNVTGTVPETSVTFNGFAPGNSTVTIKEGAVTLGTTITNPSGTFSRTFTSDPGSHNFTLTLTDTSSKTTPPTSVNGVVLTNQSITAVDNIHLPPTISASKSSLRRGESINFSGQSAPGSTLHLVLNGNEIYSTTIAGGSSWSRTISSGYQTGNNSVHAFLTRSGASNSMNSSTVSFSVTAGCRRSDLNCDGRVNLTDFSILLYYWDTTNANADINDDGRVGLVDFSIMLFDWTD